jgi:hypothetical protein
LTLTGTNKLYEKWIDQYTFKKSVQTANQLNVLPELFNLAKCEGFSIVFYVSIKKKNCDPSDLSPEKMGL